MDNTRLLTAENLANMLASSRTQVGKSQKYMCKALGKSLGTIQNWESGYSAPNVLDMISWFNALGLNPLRYILECLYPNQFRDVAKSVDNASITDEQIDEALNFYLNNIASSTDKQKLAYCIFGNSGSSFTAQLDMMTAHNHTSVRSRVTVAQTIYDSFTMEEATKQLVGIDAVMPNLENLKNAIANGKESAMCGKKGYVNVSC